tara:strand:+ start:998 stop:1150 length:153 start_codon:yes stop_codon:yes gene_type:complete
MHRLLVDWMLVDNVFRSYLTNPKKAAFLRFVVFFSIEVRVFGGLSIVLLK